MRKALFQMTEPELLAEAQAAQARSDSMRLEQVRKEARLRMNRPDLVQARLRCRPELA
jgi:hypothetical protein